MINLLPPIEKQNLLEEEKWKLILISALVVLVFFVSLILISLSIKIYITSQVETQEFIISQKEKEFKKAEIQDFQKEINGINESLSNLASFYQQRASFNDFIGKISNMLPEKVFLNQISITLLNEKENKFQVSLAGRASLIEDLIDFRNNLKSEKTFSQVYIPSSIWVESEDVDFNLSFQAIIKK